MKAFTLALAVAGLLIAAQSHAAVFNEVADAGQTVATAQSTGTNGAALTSVFGSLSTTVDADIYRIYITTPSAFAASAFDTSGGALDTALFLFTSTGVGLAANDDANGLTIDAGLPVGNARYANLSAGYYLLGISNSSNEPVNSANQLIFSGYTNGDTTSIRGPASGLNPTTEATFNGFQNTSDNSNGTYRIDLTGVSAGPAGTVAAAPEPSVWALMLGGVGMIGMALRSRRRQPKLARATAV